MASPSSFQDPELYQWCFFRRYDTRGDSVQSQFSPEPNQYRDTFKAVLVKAAKDWLGVANYSPPADNLFHDNDSRLLGVGRTVVNGLRCQAQAFPVADSFCLFVGQEYKDTFTSPTLWPVPPRRTEFFAASPYYIGEVDCLGVQVEEGLTPQEREALAKELAKRWLPEAKWGHTLGIHIVCGYMVRLITKDRESFLLLYSPSQAKAWGRVLHILLPPIFLIYLKWRVIKDSYATDLLNAVEKDEVALKNSLGTIDVFDPNKSLGVKTLESYHTSLSRAQMPLTQSRNRIENRLQTLKVNSRSLEMLRKSSLWGTPPAALLLADDIDLLIQQIESDLHYLELTQQQARLVTEHIKSVTEVHNAKTATTLTVIFGLFAALSVPQVFTGPYANPADTAQIFWWKVGMVAAGAVGVFLLVTIFQMKKIPLKN